MKEDKRKGMGRYWYFITIYECVMGDRTEEFRERQYTPKPKKWGDRHKIKEVVCGNHY